jgi:hypothetical protein
MQQNKNTHTETGLFYRQPRSAKEKSKVMASMGIANTKPNQTTPKQTRPKRGYLPPCASQAPGHQTMPTPTKPKQTKANQTKPNQTKPNQTKINQSKPKIDPCLHVLDVLLMPLGGHPNQAQP